MSLWGQDGTCISLSLENARHKGRCPVEQDGCRLFFVYPVNKELRKRAASVLPDMLCPSLKKSSLFSLSDRGCGSAGAGLAGPDGLAVLVLMFREPARRVALITDRRLW